MALDRVEDVVTAYVDDELIVAVPIKCIERGRDRERASRHFYSRKIAELLSVSVKVHEAASGTAKNCTGGFDVQLLSLQHEVGRRVIRRVVHDIPFRQAVALYSPPIDSRDYRQRHHVLDHAISEAA